ncbi:MAG: sodium:alanine symporter family protein, partial [Peptococcaceae bacterium]|nr:sodium:alanine symporter family protein [Peptococcaceae bacterium]
MIFEAIIRCIHDLMWGLPMLALLLGTGLFLTLRLRFMPLTHLGYALKLAYIPRPDADDPGDVSQFQALMTSLAATIGTGNIVGVATAVALGGPGSIFWMWIAALAGMATKYAEAALAVRYRIVGPDGQMAGGPMYYIERGLGIKPLAVCSAFFTIMASFGIGSMVQSNSAALSLELSFQIPPWQTGLVLMALTGVVVMKGIRGIARAAAFLVPFMAILYVAASVTVVALNMASVPGALMSIVVSAFSGPEKAAAGFGGIALNEAMRYGLSRGIFSNEAGLGSSPIADAAARTDHPGRQALISMTGTFVDTLVICTMTGLVLTIARMKGIIGFTEASGVLLAKAAFSVCLPGGRGGWIVPFCMVLFGYSTVLSWIYYGEKSVAYLFGDRWINGYRAVYVLFLGVGAVVELDLVWMLSDIFNGFMAIPNLIALILLNKAVTRESDD